MREISGSVDEAETGTGWSGKSTRDVRERGKVTRAGGEGRRGTVKYASTSDEMVGGEAEMKEGWKEGRERGGKETIILIPIINPFFRLSGPETGRSVVLFVG